MRPRFASLGPAAFLALALVAGGCGPAPVTMAGTLHHPVTTDGWRLTLEHFPPVAGAPRRPRPVVLCHGILANRNYFKFDEGRSVVAQLNRAGYDVWLLDLRGRDAAGAPGYFFGEHRYTYSVDDYIHRDIDAALGYVTRKTRAQDVVWIGHSLGGIIAYARIGTIGEPRIAQLVTLGSPILPPPASLNVVWAIQRSDALEALPALPVGSAGSTLASVGVVPDAVNQTFIWAPNAHHDEVAKLSRFSANDGSRRELLQMNLSTLRGEIVSEDGQVSYSAGVSNITIPALVIGARRDHLADPSAVRRAYERLGSKDKELIILGRSTGFSVDFGHTDLIIGDAATSEVIPKIVAWLDARNAASPEAAALPVPAAETVPVPALPAPAPDAGALPVP